MTYYSSRSSPRQDAKAANREIFLCEGRLQIRSYWRAQIPPNIEGFVCVGPGR